ncbi:hypothetical protein OsI_24780 [Oryza sativa Indica Group]|uniref:Uncharacterized protein n=1 Tax=Oryza sativa subsp. indica TaxID=39946 RepID=A2YHV7_ORYSI|nr:hypothetical protein OsI_24780 [Oryza sativa Indica Group]
MTAFVYLLLPETKGLPIEQVGKLWARHWFWRRFVVLDSGDGEEEGRAINADKLGTIKSAVQITDRNYMDD